MAFKDLSKLVSGFGSVSRSSGFSKNIGNYDAAADTGETVLAQLEKRIGNYVFVTSEATLTTDNLGVVHVADKLEYDGSKWLNVTAHDAQRTLKHFSQFNREEANKNIYYQGQVVTFPNNVNFIDGFFQLNGQSITRSQSIYLSDRYGNGAENFTLPDWRGRSLVFAGNSKTIDDFRGSDEHTMTIDELVSHSHSGDDYVTASGHDADDPDWLSGTRFAIHTLNYTSNNTNNTGGGQPFPIEQSSVVAGYPFMFGV